MYKNRDFHEFQFDKMNMIAINLVSEYFLIK